MQGYTGANCTQKCPYPSYGDTCQGTCNCSVDLCDSFWGCRTLNTFTTGGYFKLHFFFVNIYTFPSQNNYEGNDALLNVLKRKYVIFGFNVGKIFALINKHVNQNIALTKQCATSSKL